MMHLYLLDLASIVIYLFCIIFLGFWFSRKNKKFDLFTKAVGSISGWTIGISLYATLGISFSGAYGAQVDKIKLIFDTDANNELDDQHALAYLLFNKKTFDLQGITTNATHGGGEIQKHYLEAKRILQLCAPDSGIPLLKGANKGYLDILPFLNSADYDGRAAVDFIARSVKQNLKDQLVILAVGKLTNVALAIKKYPEILTKIKVVWLGSNYPEPGEYNLKADTSALNFILKSPVAFEMVTVRYGSASGSDAVRVTKDRINQEMPGMGPRVTAGIVGRRDAKQLFYTFGDYSVDLFKYISYKTTPPSRAMFDLVAAAILKNPAFGQARKIPSPLYINGQWVEQKKNARKITLWENFNTEGILTDFFSSVKASSAEGVTVKQPVDQWDFEEQGAKNQMNTSGDARFANGLAILGSGKGAGQLNLASAKGVSNEKTIWIRLRLPETEKQNLSIFPPTVFLKTGGLELYYIAQKDKKKGYVYGIGAKNSSSSAASLINPNPQINLPGGSWIQVATTINREANMDIVRVYCRPELTGKNLNNWIYTGKFVLTQKEHNQQNSILVNGNPTDGAEALPIDEVRIYGQALTFTELTDLWPTMKNFSQPAANKIPGTIIDYIPSNTGRFIAGSPSIVVLEDGTYIAKGDDYGPAVGISELVRIYRSLDKGETWKQISEIEGLTWASLFTHKKAIYMLGTTAGHGLGHTAIVKSTDGGLTWTKPKDSNSGLIFSDLSYHTAPVPVVIHGGRIWRTMEDEKGPGGWGTNFRAFLMSAAVDSDLLKAASWSFSDRLGYDSSRLEGRFKGWLEGNTLITPDGRPANMLRVSMAGGGGKTALITYDKEGKTSNFDPQKDFIDFPGGSTKFHIVYDPLSKCYWALSNAVPEKHNGGYYSEGMIRNTLVLMTSGDLRNWKIADTVLYHPDIAKHGFQYPVFAFDGDDMVFVSRTAYDDGIGGAYRQHDVNYFTFHRISNFRKYAPK